jgi:bifunctional non-homologous end joining protein LigD
LLQKWQKQAGAPLAYYLFDLLWMEGMDVAEPVLERWRRLTQVIFEVPGIQLGGYLEGWERSWSPVAKEKGMEGIVAKRKDSIYQTGRRNLRLAGRSKQGSSKNSLSEDLAKVKAAGKTSVPYY